MSLLQRLQSGWDAFRQTNWQAQLHYALFRLSQNLQNPNGWWQQYQQRFRADWATWLGLGAVFTALLMLLDPDAVWQWQLLLLVAGTLAAPLLASLWQATKRLFTEYPGKQFIGMAITLEDGIQDGAGTVRLDNQEWQLVGTDCPAGTQVRVIAVKDRTLYTVPLGHAGQHEGQGNG